jgi:polar amino acid transport system substrate-binding protein
MQSFVRRPLLAVGAIALTLGSVAACGSSGSSSGKAQTVKLDSRAAGMVPSSLKSKTLIVAADATYAPNEFLGSNGTTVEGMDADLAKAIAQVLGLKIKVQNATFNAIIPGLADGRFDLGMSSFTDTKEREKTVDFVTYFSAGTSFYEKSGGPPVTNLASLCGLKAAAESGTTQEADIKAQSKKCPANKKLTGLSFTTQNEVNTALNAGRTDVAMADSPVADYQVKQSSGTFKLVGTPYGTAPYGIAIPKGNGMAPAVLAAVKDLMANGTYKQILTKWGIASGAINNPVINGAIS